MNEFDLIIVIPTLLKRIHIIDSIKSIKTKYKVKILISHNTFPEDLDEMIKINELLMKITSLNHEYNIEIIEGGNCAQDNILRAFYHATSNYEYKYITILDDDDEYILDYLNSALDYGIENHLDLIMPNLYTNKFAENTTYDLTSKEDSLRFVTDFWEFDKYEEYKRADSIYPFYTCTPFMLSSRIPTPWDVIESDKNYSSYDVVPTLTAIFNSNTIGYIRKKCMIIDRDSSDGDDQKPIDPKVFEYLQNYADGCQPTDWRKSISEKMLRNLRLKEEYRKKNA